MTIVRRGHLDNASQQINKREQTFGFERNPPSSSVASVEQVRTVERRRARYSLPWMSSTRHTFTCKGGGEGGERERGREGGKEGREGGREERWE